MSDALIGTIVTAIMTVLVAALPPSIMAYRSYQEAKRAAKIAARSEVAVVKNTLLTTETKTIVEEVARKTDGQLSALIAEVRTVADAAGFARGVADTEAVAAEVKRIDDQRDQNHAAGLAEGRAEKRLTDTE